MKQTLPKSFDVLGNIAIVNFPRDFKLGAKKKFAEKLLKEHKNIKTVLEKSGRVKGRLRKPTTRHLAGEKTKEVLYKENDCVFRFNVDTTYFSPRLSNERKEIASLIKKNEDVLVMFAGVAPFSIVIAKKSKARRVVSNEINREASKYAKLNVERNNVKDRVEVVQGDIKKWVEKLREKGVVSVGGNEKMPPFSASRKEREENRGLPRFDVIVMPRPQLKDTFLEQAFMLSKKGTRIYYYDFCRVGEAPLGVPQSTEFRGKDLIVEKIKKEAERDKKKIKILKVKKAGEIAPYKIRVRVDFKIL